jgi:nucleoside-diphosphate-sugar epimerase
MRVLLLGATGFLGSWCARALSADGHDVDALCRPTSDTWRIGGIAGISVSTAESGAWPREIEEKSPDVLISLDWEGVAGSSRDDEATQRRNVVRFRAVVEAAVRAGVKRFVGVGSQAEYGPVSGSVSEDSPLRPASSYGRGKVDAFRELRRLSQATALTWTWGRVFSVYGPLEGPGWLLPSIAESARNGNHIALTAATKPWSYLYAADAARAIVALAVHPAAVGTYNVGSRLARPLRDSIETFAGVIGATELLDFGARPSPATLNELRPDVSRLESLGWREQTELDEGLALTAKWLAGAQVGDPFSPGRSLPVPLRASAS